MADIQHKYNPNIETEEEIVVIQENEIQQAEAFGREIENQNGSSW